MEKEQVVSRGLQGRRHDPSRRFARRDRMHEGPCTRL